MEREFNLSPKTPCKKCPYRKDAPKAFWEKSYFEDLMQPHNDTVYGCHCNGKTICRGWAMVGGIDKSPFAGDKYLTNVARLMVCRTNVTPSYIFSLKSKTPLFDTVEEMCIANYPKLKINL